MRASSFRSLPGGVWISREQRARIVCSAFVAIATALALLSTAAVASAAPSATLTGHWTFDEGSGTVAADSSGGGHPLTLQNGASWGGGVVGPNALSVDGSSQFGASTGPVIDTTASFTVSAWVNLNNTNGYQTFVSQDGNEVSGFYLQLRADTGRFAFTRIVADALAQAAIASAGSIIPGRRSSPRAATRAQAPSRSTWRATREGSGRLRR
jgi:Concanavalin A-like lectin/glucanases superfamily